MNIKIGDKYKECDNRFDRIVTVTGFDNRGFVQLNGRTFANPKRFNGKHGGYRKIEDVSQDTAEVKSRESGI